ncbi:hypothetical protein SADUNF_Sadunf06G0187800 [Salix dunnii]|uniref:Uncharacterized protein n=1 Tax=Salix dunnii TaxID=1413687 RepID=A0A835K112_9ROSI|nr:hypothetical protein SADUNF_Sadunf06G0187800 [Salix dunnii]
MHFKTLIFIMLIMVSLCCPVWLVAWLSLCRLILKSTAYHWGRGNTVMQSLFIKERTNNLTSCMQVYYYTANKISLVV